MATTTTVVRQYGHFINGEELPPSSDRIARHRPSDGTLVAEFSAGTPELAQEAVQAARTAFEDGPWPHMSGVERARALQRLAGLIAENKEDLARLDAEEVGTPLRQARGDLETTVALTEYAAGLAMSLHGEVHSNLGPDLTGIIMREPAGVAGLITPWNFPVMLLAQKLPFALAAGCTVVVKPSEFTSSTTLEVAKLTRSAGIPEGVVNVVTGTGPNVGQVLAESPDVDVLSFTGSTATGQRIIETSKHTIKRLSLELGGKASNIVFDDADMDDALDGVLFGLLFNQGECCVSGSRLLVHENIADEFLKLVRARIEKLRVGPPLEALTDVGPLIHDSHLAKVSDYVQTALAEGAELVTGGQRLQLDGYDGGVYFPPTILDRVVPEATVFREEIFGPVLSVTRFRDEEEAAWLANDVEFGLANSVWTKNIDTAMRMSRALRSGTVWINTTIDGAPQLPGGGVKTSGYGREMGQAGFEEFTEIKTVQIRTGARTPFFGN
ncbi:aldehyde dehydrogenase family protein [Saccharopolyspora sp. NPDC049426]|uniref:aldehyde dehydrogenase family protein n=1 Tax=Saccharopolyspora sp. NPDC049426 TaxID=3155652 RepID=UPI00342D9622